jgi:hypothetical protein
MVVNFYSLKPKHLRYDENNNRIANVIRSIIRLTGKVNKFPIFIPIF